MNKHKALTVVVAFIFTLFLSATEGYSQTCPSPVRLAEDSSDHLTIQSAYDYASVSWTDFTLLLVAETFNEDLFLNGGSVLLDGGHDCSFTSKISSTAIPGSITISTGSVTFEDIVITSPICAFDSDGDGFTSIGSCTGSADDCDDNDPNNFPGNPEICDGLDNNCDGQADEGLTAVDSDGDGYTAIGSCDGSADDCEDLKWDINPGANEILGDGIDQDCDGHDLIYPYEYDCLGCHGIDTHVLNNQLHQSVAAPDVTCAGCHDARVNAVLPGHYGETVITAGNNMAAGEIIICISCHDWHDPAEYDVGNADVVWSKVYATWVGSPTYAYVNLTCDTCHENRASFHTAMHTVEVGPNDLSQSPPGTPCSNCHVVANWPEIEGVVHNVATNGAGSCSTCHNSPRQEVIDAIFLSYNPTYCLDCHSDKELVIHGSVQNIDHVGLGYMTQAVNCSGCHDATLGTPFVDPANNLIHDACTTCHVDPENDDYTLVAAASGGVGGGDCTVCHSSDFTTVHPEPTVDHTSLVILGTTNCAGCHSDPPPLVDAGDPTNHNACISCHDAASGALIGSAIGKTFAAGGDCATCHTGNWGTAHTNDPGHTGITVGATGCATCHDDTLVSAAPETHNACTSCHDAGTGALIGSAVGNPTPTDCTTCHTGTWSAMHTADPGHTGITVGATGCADCHDDTLVSAAPETHNACTSCHDAGTGALIGSAVGNPTPTDCTTCHTGTWETTHTTDPGHTGITVGATGCATCHDDTLVSAAPETHNACTSCHDAGSGALIGSAVGNPTPTDCTTCHTGTWGATHTTDPGHTGITVGASTCAGCHDDTLVSAAPETHNACTSCHDAATGSLIGSAVGNPTPTDCTTCHTGTWGATHTTDPGHTGITVGASTCAGCHDDTLVSAAADTHNACTSCHDAGTGALIGSAVGNPTPTDCTTCHTGTWEAEHPEPTADHISLVTVGITNCAGCHSDPPPLVDAGDPKVHNGCVSCHNSTTGALISSAIGKTFAAGGDCATCHTGTFDSLHAAHTHTVAVGSGDLSYDPPGTLCSVCHVVANWSEIDGVEHNVATNGAGSCSTCHNSSRQEVVDAITLGADPTNCLDCHSNKNLTVHGDFDHVALGYVTVGATSCTSCHDPGAAADATISITHNGNCNLCHTTVPDLQPGVPAGGGDCVTCHGSDFTTVHPEPTADHTSLVTVGTTNCTGCHSDPPPLVDAGDATNHNTCSSCHDANGALISSAIGKTFAAGGDCATCHTGTWEATHTTDPGHTGITVGASTCAGCHDDTLVSAAPETHNACTSCHDAGTGALIGSAVGNPSPTDCTTCHTGTWETTHTNDPGHTGITVGATGCATCHDDTLVSAAPETHNSCTSCHDAGTGALIGSAVGNPTPTDCTTCHTGTWEAEHPEPTADHTNLVTVGTTDCASCHSDPPPLVDVGDATNHNTCSSCHDANGALISSAIGKTFAAGGDCATCHTDTWSTIHPTTGYSHTGITVGATGCADCHDDTLVSAAPETHNACTSCHDAGTGALIGSAIGNPNPTDCTTCHTGTWESTHTTDPGHTGITVGASSCAGCHSDTPFIDAGDPTNHNSCTSCHDAGTGALIGSAVGNPNPTDCTTCHTGTWGGMHTADPGHTGITVGATGCATCHDDTLVSAAPETHNACTSCHDSGTGALIGSAIGNPNPTDCTTCHTGTWGGMHTTDPGHTGITVGATGCADCHSDTPFIDAGDPTNHNSCTSCHDAGTGALIGSAIGNPSPTDCMTCHTGTWETTHTTDPGHTGITVGATGCADCHSDTPFIDAGDPANHNSCTSCHDAGTGALIGSAVGNPSPTDCTTCHTGTWETTHTTDPGHTGITVGATGCATCHDDTLVSAAPETHNACTSCHDSGTGALIGSAIGNPSPTDCTTCHTGTWGGMHTTDPGHTGITVGATGCATCHDDTLVSAAPETHNGCTSCHDSGTGALIGSAIGNPTPTDCTTCHTGTWGGMHTTDPGHTGITVGATGCADCHSDTPFIDAGDPANHNSCTSCHDAGTGALVGSAVGNPTPTDCTTCHTDTWSTIHPTTGYSHAGITVGATSCADCHDDTLVSAAPETHNACTSCHDSGTGALIGSATGNPSPTDCTTCHTGTWETLHPTTSYDHLNIVTVTGTTDLGGCGQCHSDPPPLVDAGDSKVHNACVSCHDSTDGSLISIAAGASAPGNCETCHINKEAHGNVDHEALGYIMDSSTLPGCQSCHVGDTSAGGVHSDCTNCHTATPPDLKSSPSTPYTSQILAGGGACEDCHNGHNIVEEAGIDITQTPPQMCGECHGGTDRRFSDFSEIKVHHYNHCQTCHESTDPTVMAVVDQYDGGPNHVNCSNCHTTVGDHSGHPNIKAGIRGSQYSDDALGQQTLTCFTAGCHADNTVTEHLSPRGIAYKNFEAKYGQPFTCQMCHQNKYPVEVIRLGKVCSDPAYPDQASCEAATPRWRRSTGDCSDPQYPDQASCEAGTLSWDDLVFNSDPVINDAIALGIAGNPVYCSDCHKEDIERFDKGECSDPARVNEVECEFSCTNPSYTTQVECLQNGETWDVPTGETWTPAGYCNDIRFNDQAACEAGGEPVWYAATLACSDPQYPDQTSCENAVTTPIWHLVMPYSIHDKYNGIGIYSFSEKHHEAEIWTGTCSNSGITDEDACYADGSTWTPTYTPGNTFVGNGDCTACHKDPRKQPYAGDVCSTSRYATAAACISAGLASYGGSCSIPEYLNTYDCTDNGGTWSGGICLDYQYSDQASCEAGDPGYTSWIAHPAGAGKTLPMPKQLPCVECHAKVDAVGNTMTIYKEKTGSQIDPFGTYGGWVRTETGHIANTVDHVCSDDNYTTQQACDPVSNHSWYEPLGVCVDSTYTDRASCDAAPNHHWETPCSDNAYDDQDTCIGTWEGVEHKWAVNGGNIQDYGACLFCHKMRPYHAYPGPPPDDPDTNVVDQDFYDDGYADAPHYPCFGRGSLGVFFGKHRKPFKYYQSTGQSSYKNAYKAIRDADALPDDTVSWWSNIIYDPQDDPTGMVPTTSFCSDPTIVTRSECENAGHWWRPAHIMGTPEYFTIPTFDPPISDPGDAITIENGTGYNSRDMIITVEATTQTSSTGVIYAVWSGKAKPMNLDSSGGGNNTWLVTFTSADGVLDLDDSTAGRVYVISVDETSDNHDLLYQVFTDL